MRISTRKGVFVFAASVTLVTVICASLLNFLIYPPELLFYTVSGTMMITICVAFPTCLFIGRKMHENQRLSDELQRLVNRDRLTDVATRDFFFSRLTEFPDSYGVSLMVDIDHFKRVNDTHGHLAGDHVIQNVARIMKDQIRDVDIVCRFGGEEFVVFLKRASPEEGWVIAERIREKIEAATTQTGGGGVKVTVSVGGSMKEQIEEVEDAIKRADACLYRAKESGRNKTVVDWQGIQSEHTLRAS